MKTYAEAKRRAKLLRMLGMSYGRISDTLFKESFVTIRGNRNWDATKAWRAVKEPSSRSKYSECMRCGDRTHRGVAMCNTCVRETKIKALRHGATRVSPAAAKMPVSTLPD